MNSNKHKLRFKTFAIVVWISQQAKKAHLKIKFEVMRQNRPLNDSKGKKSPPKNKFIYCRRQKSPLNDKGKKAHYGK